MRHFYIPILIVILNSCVSAFDVKLPDHDSCIVINSYLSEGDSIKVHISKSIVQTGYLHPYLQGAEVVLISGDDCDTLLFRNDGWYHSTWVASAGQTYALEVNVLGYKSAYAITKVPEKIDFNVENYIARAGILEIGTFYSSIDIVIYNNINENVFYELTYKSHDVVRYYDQKHLFAGIWSETIEIKDENPWRHLYLVFSNKSIINNDPFTVNYAYSNNIDSVDLVLRNVCNDYYLFKKSLIPHLSGQISEGIWDENDVFPLYSNIKNGFGIFASYIETKQTIYTYTEK